MATNPGVVGTTAAAAWLPTVFAPAINGYWRENVVLAQFATDYSSLVMPGAKAVSIPKMALDTAATKTSQTALSYNAGAVQAVATITLSTQYAYAYLFEDIAQLETNVDLMGTYARMGADGLAMALDTLLATTVKGETTNTAITTGTDDTILYTDLLTAQKNLNIQRIKTRNCVMGISPEAFQLSVPDWTTNMAYNAASSRGDGQAVVYANGVEGRILGLNVVVSDDWDAAGTAETATIWHPTALAFAHTGILFKGPVQDPLNIGDALTIHDIMGAVVVNAYGVQAFLND